MDIATILTLVLGILIGCALGWLLRAYTAPQSQPQPTPAGLNQPALAPAEMSAIQASIGQLGVQLQALESERSSSYASLASQVQAMARTSTRLNDRTSQLVNAMRSPQVRGRWGEIQLERVIELGGMVRHCDFDTQVSARLGDQLVRPDVVVHLAGGRSIVIDSKVPYTAYVDALDTEDPEEKEAYLRRHAHLIRSHVNALSSKGYIDAFSPTPEFVVAFVPADPFLDAALSVDPELIEYAFERNIVLATPTTLFALLRTVALGWQREDVNEKAKEIQRLGRELYQRLNTVSDHINRLGRSLEKSVDAFNQTVGSLDTRVAVTARKLSEMDITARADRRPADVDYVQTRPRFSGNSE